MKQGILWAVLVNLPQIKKRFSEGEPHHITLLFGCDRQQVTQYKRITFTALVTEECWNDHIQALCVKLPSGIPHDGDRHPHITVSRTAGIEPVESNAMLASQRKSQFVEFALTCRIEFLEWKTEK